jgi:CRISPR-associated protein Csm2
MSYLNDHPINEKWFLENVTDETVTYAENLAKHLVEEEKIPNTNSFVVLPLTTSQLRKFFGVVKNIQLDFSVHGYNESDFVMLKPKLAYAVGRVRQKNSKCRERRIEDFAEILSSAMDIVNRSKDRDNAFKNFINFFEAIVAYHKRYGKDS